MRMECYIFDFVESDLDRMFVSVFKKDEKSRKDWCTLHIGDMTIYFDDMEISRKFVTKVNDCMSNAIEGR